MSQNYKSLKRNISTNLNNLKLGSDFLDVTKMYKYQIKIDKWYIINIVKHCASEDTIKNEQNGRKYFK